MSRGFESDFKELVRANTNLVDLISESVALKPLRAGADYVGLCPFHEDRNPSLHVYPDRSSYRCWVCDAGGDCFRWVMEIDKVSFPEAVESLARRANLEIPKSVRQQGAAGGDSGKKSETYDVLEWATNLMQQALRTGPAGANARGYVDKRKLTDETLRVFRLGYHPEDWNWFLNRAAGRFTPDQLLLAGLIGERPNAQGYYDNLVGRLIFPIRDEKGRVVAFGGRVLPGGNIESDAKYWNSRESGIFHKSRMLYAFDQARKAIRDSKTAIVVEGYMDCIACHQAGVQNVVATLGTALTEEHVKFLRRFVDRVVLTYDSDAAGQRAAERSIKSFMVQEVDLRILTLPNGKDPADFLEVRTGADLQELVETAPEAWEYKLQSLVTRIGLESINGRQQILNQMLEFMSDSPGLAGSVREELILRNVCHRIQVDERLARRQLTELREKTAQRNRVTQQNRSSRIDAQNQRSGLAEAPMDVEPPVSSERKLELAERELLEIILTVPETIDVIRHQLGADDFENEQHRRLLALCIDIRKEDGDLPELDRLIAAADSDGGLLSLINAVLDSAEEKGILQLMNQDTPDHEEENGIRIPLHLLRVLLPLLERREKRRHLLSKQRMAQTDASKSELNSEQKEALRQLTSFRKNQMGHPTKLK